MKLLNKIYIILIYIALQSCVAFSQDCKTNVLIKTKPDSINIFLNNNYIGKGFAKINLNKGKYKISAKESPVRWDAESISDTLNITGCGKDTAITLDLIKKVYLTTNPQDAYVYEHENLIGFTPLFVPLISDTLTLKKPGYLTKSLLISHKYSDVVIKLDAISQPGHKNFFEGKAFKILAGSIVVLGAATAYFKLKADDQFNQYENTREPTLLNQTRRNDLISGITLGALEINFGILLYYFLSD